MIEQKAKRLQLVKFAPKETERSFFDDVRKAVSEHFAGRESELHGDGRMVVKTIAMFAIYLIPFMVMASGLTAGMPILFWGCWVLMAVGMVGIGTSVMHDSNHGAYSERKLWNRLLGGAIHLIGGYDVTWKIQHNVLHHTYTNIDHLDEDLDGTSLLRFTPNAPLKKVHRFQHIYAWFMYGLLTINWSTAKDYKALVRYHKLDLLKKQRVRLTTAILELTAIRLLYFAVIIGLPVLYSGYGFAEILIGFVVMHFLAGLSLSCIFQLAHIMEPCEFPVPGQTRRMENSWAVHQLLNTMNFAPKNRVLSWFIGGLNYQIEHHLFPSICHVHYKELSKVIRRVANEHALPYRSEPTLRRAMRMHWQMLWSLGKS